MKNNGMIKGALSIAIVAGLYANSAVAAGPLFLFKPGQPYKYDVSTPVPVYTDQGQLCNPDVPSWYGFGCLTNEQADALTEKAVAEWNNVQTSTFKAAVKGKISADITAANAGTIIGADNGGGIHVLYDADSSIITEFFGAPEDVLGIASPEFADENGILTESWVVVNVSAVPQSWESDPAAKIAEEMAHAQGVFTHEFGHSINLSHSQTNGRKVMNSVDGAPGECSAAFDSAKVDYPDGWNYPQYVANVGRIETMYPFVSPYFTGDVMGTVDITDDKVALSNIYPTQSYLAAFGTIKGKILLSDESTELSGINIVARNINNPYYDAVSAMSGDQSQGMIGPDGSFTINGLTPGEEYVVYVEQIHSGGYPTPPASLPSIAEYYNGAGENGNAAQDDPCAYTPIKAVAGQSADATIAFNGTDRAPLFVMFPAPNIDEVSRNGKTLAGVVGPGLSWIWDARNGFRLNDSSKAALSENGQIFVGTKEREVHAGYGGMDKPGYWDELTGWTYLDLPSNDTCDGSLISTWDTDDKAEKIVGLGWSNGCKNYSAVVWDGKQRKPSWQYLDAPTKLFDGEPEGIACSYDDNWNPLNYCKVYGSRANAIAGNGSVIVGHVDAGGWYGAAWINGKFQLMGTDTYNGWIGSANDINVDGTAATGGDAGGEPVGEYYDWWTGQMVPELDTTQAYIWSYKTGTKLIGNLPCPPNAWGCSIGLPAKGYGISDDASTVVGLAGSFSSRKAFIWRESIGMVDLNEFLQHQGVMASFATDFYPKAISGSGNIIVGQGIGKAGYGGVMVKLDQVWVCHNGNSNLAGFPGGMDSHIAHGDQVGLCEADRPIQPK